MSSNEHSPEDIKENLHPDNRHRFKYDFEKFIKKHPKLKRFVSNNKYGQLSINFFDPKAVRTLNTILLKQDYGVKYWEFPRQYLCPPIPGRADYLLYLNDLLVETNAIDKKHTTHLLDVGTGANCIFPLLALKLFNWQVSATEVDRTALRSAKNIVYKNNFDKQIRLFKQKDRTKFFQGIVQPQDNFAACICNPPFHATSKEATSKARKKLEKLTRTQVKDPVLNFGGTASELTYPGGELIFIKQMIKESKRFQNNFKWFTCLVSKSAHVRLLKRHADRIKVAQFRIVPMSQGNKKSRFIAWHFRFDSKPKSKESTNQ